MGPPQQESPNDANLRPTAILDWGSEEIRALISPTNKEHSSASELRRIHSHLASILRPVYSVNEWQPASTTLRRRRGSCSQRMACLEAVARAAGIPTRVQALRVSGKFWFPRFRMTRCFIPEEILLLWPQFFVEDEWRDFDELHAPMEKLVAGSDDGFTNAGESLFEAVQHTPIDFLGKTCGMNCARPQHNLSGFVSNSEGYFETRDEALEKLGSFQFTIRGRIFELLYGDRSSAPKLSINGPRPLSPGVK